MIRQALKDLYLGPKAAQERRTDFFVYAIYRPLSFALTPAFLRVGATATQVTVLNLLLACLMPVAALLAGQPHLWLALITFACIVLDCVDGNIARATASSSALGQYLDSLVGKAYFILLAVALAIVAAAEVPAIAPGYWLALGLTAAVLKIWSREARAYCRLHLPAEAIVFAAGPVGWKTILFSATKLVPLGLLVLGSVGMSWLVLAGLLMMNVAAFLYTQRRILRQLSRSRATGAPAGVAEP
jgi:phosphatidylglycerophosphate synthase